MNELTITIAAGDYEHLRDLAYGQVTVTGVKLRWLALPPEEIFFRFTVFREWDVSEMSLAKYCSLRARGDDSLTALPVFPSRVFRHSAIYVRGDGSVKGPADLRGRRVGIPEWTQTAGIYVRGMLEEEHGVGMETIDWVQTGLDDPGREEIVVPEIAPDVRLTAMPERQLSEMLVEGEIDAIISARVPRAVMAGSGEIVRLFADPEDAERRSFERTGVFPIMHVLVVKSDVYDANPWLGQNLIEAFEEAKRRSIVRLLDGNVSRLPVPWATAGMQRAIELLGPDPWPYGLEPNRTTLEAFLGYAFRQGVCKRKLSPEELFPPSALRRYRI